MDRGQAHTLEAIVAGMLLLASLIFALQLTAVTPLSASTSSQHIENQQQSLATGVLAAAAENESLKQAILYWDVSDAKFYNTGSTRGYNNNPPDIAFGRMLNAALDAEGIVYNVYFVYQKVPSGDEARRAFIDRGVPSDNAVVAGRTVTIHDYDRIRNPDGTESEMDVTEATSFYMDNQDTSSTVYNVVRVEVVAWRI